MSDNYLPIHEYTESEGHKIMKDILSKIYIARNISLDEAAIIEQFKVIDKLMATSDDYE